MQQSVDGFDEDSRWMCTRLLRCHSENNSADDEDTSVWSSVFPESGRSLDYLTRGGVAIIVGMPPPPLSLQSGKSSRQYSV